MKPGEGHARFEAHARRPPGLHPQMLRSLARRGQEHRPANAGLAPEEQGTAVFSSIGEKSLEHLQFTLPTDQRGSRFRSGPVIDWFRKLGDRAGECPGLTVGAMTPPD